MSGTVPGDEPMPALSCSSESAGLPGFEPRESAFGVFDKFILSPLIVSVVPYVVSARWQLEREIAEQVFCQGFDCDAILRETSDAN